MELYIMIYTHRHGVDVIPIWSEIWPTEDNHFCGAYPPDDYEPDREDEDIEVRGPFPIPGVIIPARKDRIIYMSHWALAKLRKHQRLFNAQIERATEQHNINTIEFLQLAYDECSDAISLKHFGEY